MDAATACLFDGDALWTKGEFQRTGIGIGTVTGDAGRNELRLALELTITGALLFFKMDEEKKQIISNHEKEKNAWDAEKKELLQTLEEKISNKASQMDQEKKMQAHQWEEERKSIISKSEEDTRVAIAKVETEKNEVVAKLEEEKKVLIANVEEMEAQLSQRNDQANQKVPPQDDTGA